jgi:hypothetical protein
MPHTFSQCPLNGLMVETGVPSSQLLKAVEQAYCKRRE